MYKTLLEPKLTYGCEIWAECLKFSKYSNIINSAQRGLLVWAISGYRTCSGSKVRKISNTTTLSACCRAIRTLHLEKTKTYIAIGDTTYIRTTNDNWKNEESGSEFSHNKIRKMLARHIYRQEDPAGSEWTPR